LAAADTRPGASSYSLPLWFKRVARPRLIPVASYFPGPISIYMVAVGRLA
jgi:hypothetical protein